jgi:hypothetical protein
MIPGDDFERGVPPSTLIGVTPVRYALKPESCALIAFLTQEILRHENRTSFRVGISLLGISENREVPLVNLFRE